MTPLSPLPYCPSTALGDFLYAAKLAGFIDMTRKLGFLFACASLSGWRHSFGFETTARGVDVDAKSANAIMKATIPHDLGFV
jgi:hypothetical protein